jgi:hypothetical protein
MYSFFARVGHPDIRWSVVSSYCLHRRHLLSIYYYYYYYSQTKEATVGWVCDWDREDKDNVHNVVRETYRTT